ncbi:mannose-1-phosphate guanylyltransferase/mannose-6-phosphate isomerase [Rhodoferax saidenbachensis]|uniref:mannose-1-phosphate guanylyltransferase n=1 Tax=Rhodoferax saidenbachensis TaxID=1484693 RepID=A0A1P8KE33_9BURK|nr:mannose-1-phosphate guanylyltransferase/mannose-6-phosphate isomerase [Rhodoferax saidenbachensis]APW44198.1 mannose-1-phosphate guanylyltransferase/mannose-6-phosphate isomerase [Rhodoferax saidenbachensis]
MRKTPITPVILCGGSGTRLWPLSRKSFPKQFVPLIDGKSLLQLTLERVAHISNQVVCVAAEEHRFLVAEALGAASMKAHTVLEPAARNTAAAMTLAALQVDSESLLLFCPADHHIPDALAFTAMVESGRSAAEGGAIVTFGVAPSFPSTAYGYIAQGAQRADGARDVRRFIEKPAAAQAQALLLQGDVLWNAGIFLCSASTLLAAMVAHAADILQSCRDAMAASTTDQVNAQTFVRPGKDLFLACRSQSIDYAVMEHHANVAVLPFNGIWSDVGSWNAVADLVTPDAQGNRAAGQAFNAHHLKACNTYIHAAGARPVVALGTNNLLIIDTPDALLVADVAHAEAVKEVVAVLESLDASQAVQHRRVARPWGWYDSIDVGDRHLVKRIGVHPGASLSLQLHRHRAEHWIVVRGTAEVTNGDQVFTLSENQSTYIPLGQTHRLANPGKIPLEIIEVQSGGYLGEDDIVRLEDTYGRR